MDYALATLRVRIDVLAERLGFSLKAWDEDGLGPSRNVFLRMPSGRPIWLQELEYAIAGGLHFGPNVLVDARDLAEFGVEAMMAEVLAALGLEADAVAWMQDSSAAADAKVLAEHALAYHAARERGV
jgi:hypothetical protein